MVRADIIPQRMAHQQLSRCDFDKPEEIVEWLGAVQAQDYAAAKWALGLRMPGTTDVAIERAFDQGTILRTHVLRPTWHFVTPADIRWMLELTAPRILAALGSYYRRFELDETLFRRSRKVLVKALQGGKHLTRAELAAILKQAGISTEDLLRRTFIILQAELDGIICSGVRRGKQQTYALLEERAPQAKKVEREEALAELAWRYFSSRGPATLKDYVWWSGLTTADAKTGIESLRRQLVHDVIEGETYWQAASSPVERKRIPLAHLLPNFDEYTVGYADRSAIVDANCVNRLDARGSVLLNYAVVVDGRFAGSWKRTFKNKAVVVAFKFLTGIPAAQKELVASAARRYGEFLGMNVVTTESN